MSDLQHGFENAPMSKGLKELMVNTSSNTLEMINIFTLKNSRIILH